MQETDFLVSREITDLEY